MKKTITITALTCFICLMMNACTSKKVIFNYVEKDSARVSLIKELKVTEIRKPTTDMFFPMFRGFAIEVPKEKGKSFLSGLGTYLMLNMLCGFAIITDIISTVLIFPFEVAFHKGDPSYKTTLRLSGEIETPLDDAPQIKAIAVFRDYPSDRYITEPQTLIENFELKSKGNILDETITKEDVKYGIRGAKMSVDIEITIKFLDGLDGYKETLAYNNGHLIRFRVKLGDTNRELFMRKGIIDGSSPSAIIYRIKKHGTSEEELYQEEKIYALSEKSIVEKLNIFGRSHKFYFDELKPTTREIKSSNKIVVSTLTFMSKHNKEEYLRMEKAVRKEKEAEEEINEMENRVNQLEAYNALLSNEVGEFIFFHARVAQVLDDGFLATVSLYGFDNLLVYVVSKHLPKHKKLYDDIMLTVDGGEITGRYIYTDISGARRTVSKVKASKINIVEEHGGWWQIGTFLISTNNEGTWVEVVQVLDDGFLARTLDQHHVRRSNLFYVVSKHLPEHKNIVDGIWLTLDLEVIGTHKYRAVSGGIKTVLKLKASKIYSDDSDD